jgi:uncharacterized protein (TIGR03086 family)
MNSDPLDLYERASNWTLEKVTGATDSLDQRTPCDEWDVRQLMNHMLDTQKFFLGRARGEALSPPSPQPPELLGDDPVADFERGRDAMLRAFGEKGVLEKTGPSLGIAFCDQLLHGWDLAKATSQEATMPDGLAVAAYDVIDGRLTADRRKNAFKPEIAVGPHASAQEKLLAYTGRNPTG